MVSNKIRELRIMRGERQEDVARAVGVSPSTIGMLEQGRRKPGFQLLKKLSAYFRVDPNTLIDDGPQVPHDIGTIIKSGRFYFDGREHLIDINRAYLLAEIIKKAVLLAEKQDAY